MKFEERERRQHISPYDQKLKIWVKSDWFCVDCGKQDVWQAEDAKKDYYVNACTECFSCKRQQCDMELLREVKE